MLDKIAKLDSGVIRGVLVAAVPVVALLGKLLFGIDEDRITAEGNRLVELLMVLWIALGLAYISYQRLTKPTPPLTDIAAARTDVKLSAQAGAPSSQPSQETQA